MKVAILHYASPPVVGGVESTIAYHARGLADLGHEVRVLSGDGASFDPPMTGGIGSIETHVHTLLGSRDARVLAAKKQLDTGRVPAEFAALKGEIVAVLRKMLQGCDVCIVHNVHTMNKNLPLTAALSEVTGGMRFIAWCHDIAWANEQYLPELHAGAPWNLLKKAWPNTCYATVSEMRRNELAKTLTLPADQIAVVPPGVDVSKQLFLTTHSQRLVRELNLMDADGILLLPARITRRKNIELGLQVLAELRAQSGRDFRLLVTGPPGPHNPANPGYLGELLQLRAELGLQQAAHFMYEHGEASAPGGGQGSVLESKPFVPDDAAMANFYTLADALFFPSTQEGFGIPILEAGLANMPIFCADLPPFRATALDHASYFDGDKDPPSNIAARVLAMLDQLDSFALRVRVRKHFRWEAIIQKQLVPLLG
jgi:glycosyltransferase involved in cell wall biosynthesis